ncbi:hypothetical protein ACDA63_19940 [Uliginosibacterium sp. sgz301328]|uniref:hypothetical protein n=1 Tax=Uliginosibacterium sp. sgz301328 TaxID=3243764 RepID=UPI00359DDFA8
MNWMRLYATVRMTIVIGCGALGGAAAWALIAAAAFGHITGIGETRIMLFVFLPVFVVVLGLLTKYLPREFFKKGILADPRQFGPWKK